MRGLRTTKTDGGTEADGALDGDRAQEAPLLALEWTSMSVSSVPGDAGRPNSAELRPPELQSRTDINRS